MKKILLYSTIILTLLITPLSHAEDIPGTDFSVNLEQAIFIGSGISLNILRIPLTDNTTGETQYYDMEIDMILQSRNNTLRPRLIGNVEVDPPFGVTTLLPGDYIDTGNRDFNLSDPVILSDGRLLYILTGTDHNMTIELVTGSPVGHPNIGDRAIAPDLPADYIYGRIFLSTNTSVFNTGLNNFWELDGIVGARQVNDQLVIDSFTDGGTDIAFPLASGVLEPL